mgnify:CR=1 FL=1
MSKLYFTYSAMNAGKSAILLQAAGAQASSGLPNVLFIAIDDLRPALGCYGDETAVTPNIDRLAAEGLRFDRAYCQVPVCGASRASLLSGVRPTRDRFINYSTRLDKDLPGVTSLPGFTCRVSSSTAIETLSSSIMVTW